MDIASVAPAVVLVRISGRDVGEFGTKPLSAADRLLGTKQDAHLFIDARDTQGASVEVSNEWAQWLARNRSRFTRVHMLTGSQYVRMTAEFVRRFAELGALMEIYSDSVAFDAALSQARA